MKDNYYPLELEIIKFDTEDIITTSNPDDPNKENIEDGDED